MKFFIKIENNQPVGHPIAADNFQQAFPDIDVNNLPSHFAVFERVAAPKLKTYEIYEGVTYKFFDGVVKDFHHVRDMTEQEKLQKQDAVKKDWAENGFSSWVFNQETCSFIPPIDYPADGGRYTWDEETMSWRDIFFVVPGNAD